MNNFEHIEKRIIELQQAHVCLQEELKRTQNKTERDMDEIALRLIDILDLIHLTKKSSGDVNAAPAAPVITQKIEKRLLELFKRWQVQEIVFKEDQVETGKARVLETRPVSSDIAPGTIIEICRAGYQRGSKTIRPADVITAG